MLKFEVFCLSKVRSSHVKGSRHSHSPDLTGLICVEVKTIYSSVWACPAAKLPTVSAFVLKGSH